MAIDNEAVQHLWWSDETVDEGVFCQLREYPDPFYHFLLSLDTVLPWTKVGGDYSDENKLTSNQNFS